MRNLFPNWIELLEEIYSDNCKTDFRFPKDISLSDLFDILDFFKKNESIFASAPEALADLLTEKGIVEINQTTVNENELLENLKNFSLLQDQFITIADAGKSVMIKTDQRIQDVIGIPPEEFTLKRICGLDTTHELFHPDDIPHILRLISCVIIITISKGVKIDPYGEYFRAKFRIGYSQDANKLTIERKVFLSYRSKGSNRLIHFDLWTKSHEWSQFIGIEFTFESPDIGKRNFLSLMIFTLNAMSLGITPKDLIMLKVITKYKSNYSQLQAFNEIMVEASEGRINPLTETQFKHQKRYLVQKIDELIISKSHPLSNLEQLKESSIHFKVKQLGLINAPGCFEEILFNWIKRELPKVSV